MQDRSTIQRYINDFRRHLTPVLKPGIGLAFKVHPAKADGAILELRLGPEVENDDEYLEPADTVNAALKPIKQGLVGGNIDGIRFAGTSISMEPARILLVKGEDQDSIWNDDAAKQDVKRIIEQPDARRRS